MMRLQGPAELLERMLLIRVVEKRLQRLCDKGLAGDLHFSKGQESVAVGVCEALRSSDKIVTHHRTIAHEIAKMKAVTGWEDDEGFARRPLVDDLYPLIAEILGRRTGLNKGRAGEMHLHNAAIGHLFSFQLVGTAVPVAAGIAWALRYHTRTNDVVACFIGDAAVSNGAVHEGLTIASVRRCPLLLVVENNGLAGNITGSYYKPTLDWAARFAAYGMETVSLQLGAPVDTVREFASRLVDDVRSSCRPRALVCEVPRLCWHKQGQPDARPPTVIAEQARFDSILIEQRRLGLGEEDVRLMRKSFEAEVDSVIERALGDPPAEMRYDD